MHYNCFLVYVNKGFNGTGKAMYREEWLTKAAGLIEPLLKAKGHYPKAYRVTCGWPCRKAAGKRPRIGECHSRDVSEGKVSEIFVSPMIAERSQVLGVLAHELIHAAVGVAAGHGPKFRAACKQLGLVGKPTQATPGKVLQESIDRATKGLGEYPHQVLTLRERVRRPSSVVSLECPECGCRVRIGMRWLNESGYPTCGCGGEFGSVT